MRRATVAYRRSPFSFLEMSRRVSCWRQSETGLVAENKYLRSSAQIIELLETVGPLTDPTAHGGTPADAFHLVLPSLPGYGFSSEPAELGWDAARTGRAWAELMHRLGYSRYVAQGGDVGALVTDLMGRQAVEGLVGYHLNLLTAVLAVGDHLPK